MHTLGAIYRSTLFLAGCYHTASHFLFLRMAPRLLGQHEVGGVGSNSLGLSDGIVMIANYVFDSRLSTAAYFRRLVIVSMPVGPVNRQAQSPKGILHVCR